MAEPYTDDEKSLARVLGVNVQTVRVSRFAQHLDRAFRRKNVAADIKVGKIFCGPNSEPRIEVDMSSDTAVHLATLLEGEEADEDAVQYRNDHNEMIEALKEVCAIAEEFAHLGGRDDFKLLSALHEYLKKKGYIDE